MKSKVSTNRTIQRYITLHHTSTYVFLCRNHCDYTLIHILYINWGNTLFRIDLMGMWFFQTTTYCILYCIWYETTCLYAIIFNPDHNNILTTIQKTTLLWSRENSHIINWILGENHGKGNATQHLKQEHNVRLVTLRLIFSHHKLYNMFSLWHFLTIFIIWLLTFRITGWKILAAWKRS